jgi:hypothetical protein
MVDEGRTDGVKNAVVRRDVEFTVKMRPTIARVAIER